MQGIRNRHFLLLDLLLLVVGVYAAFVLRLERFHLENYFPVFALMAVCVVLLSPLLFWRMGIYSRYWQYASIDELMLLVGTVTTMATAVTLLTYPISTTLFTINTLPRSVPFIFLMIALAVTAGPRLLARSMNRLKQGYARRNLAATRPVLIVGAGKAGNSIAQELQSNPQLGLDAIGFLDDDRAKSGTKISGIPVLGTLAGLAGVIQSHNIQQVIIAMPHAGGSIIREIQSVSEAHNVKTRIIPALFELIGGTVSVHKLRDVQLEDLLRREPIQSDIAPVQALMAGKRIMISGGGGSIGSELCRQVAGCNPSELLILDHAENSLYYMLNELAARFPLLTVHSAIVDIRNRSDLNAIYREFQPEVVFHAAAHKHVPLMEANPNEAVTNNVKGTRNLVELAAEHRVKQFVMISTDKAVKPTSVMGATKRAAERIVHHVSKRASGCYVTVRFGNVLGSSGSVVPLFQQQIEAGGPVTVTDPEITRYFMTIPEAVQLVLQAATMGKGGEVFMLDMGKPVKILDLAHDLIKLHGLRPDEDIKIVFTGLRPGEKLHEELISAGEIYEETPHEKILILRDPNGIDGVTLYNNVDALVAAAEARQNHTLRRLLKPIVPDYAYTLDSTEPPVSGQLRDAAIPAPLVVTALTPAVVLEHG